MVLEPLNKNKIRIKLSNTESVTQNIYKYATLDNDKETKSTSSTCSYFLTTNDEVGKELSNIINFNNVFICDVVKTEDCAIIQQEILSNIKENFKGSLNPFYDSFNKFSTIGYDELTLGEASIRKDSNQRYNLYFDNDNPNVSLFRNSIIAVLCDIIIEPKDDYNLIYTVMKESLEKDDNNETKGIETIMELSSNLKNLSDNEIADRLKDIIKESYKLLSKLNNYK